MILHKLTEIEKYLFSYESEEEFEKHKDAMEKAGFISNPYFHVWSGKIVQYCNYERVIRE